MCQILKGIPAAQSENGALYGLDPQTLAQLALKDASKAVEMEPDWPKVRLFQVSILRSPLTRFKTCQIPCRQSYVVGGLAHSVEAATHVSSNAGDHSTSCEICEIRQAFWRPFSEVGRPSESRRMCARAIPACTSRLLAVLHGAALTLLERYEDAEEAFLGAVALRPMDPQLHAALREIRQACGAAPSTALAPSPASSSRPSRQGHAHPAVSHWGC